MAKLTKQQQLELDTLRMELKLRDERVAVLEREHADMIAELAPASEQGAAYQSKLAMAEVLLNEMGDVAAGLVDQLRRTRQALDLVCMAAAQQDDARMGAVGAENASLERVMALLAASARLGDLGGGGSPGKG